MNIIKQLRIENELKQREVAEKIGVTLSAYSNYEQGIRQPDDDIKIRLADFYDVSLDYLITGKERDYMYREPVKSEIDRLYDALNTYDKTYVKGVIMGLLASYHDIKD